MAILRDYWSFESFVKDYHKDNPDLRDYIIKNWRERELKKKLEKLKQELIKKHRKMEAKESNILLHHSIDELCQLVNEKIKEGWQPIGGVETVLKTPEKLKEEFDQRGTIFLQSIIRV